MLRLDDDDDDDDMFSHIWKCNVEVEMVCASFALKITNSLGLALGM